MPWVIHAASATYLLTLTFALYMVVILSDTAMNAAAGAVSVICLVVTGLIAIYSRTTIGRWLAILVPIMLGVLTMCLIQVLLINQLPRPNPNADGIEHAGIAIYVYCIYVTAAIYFAGMVMTAICLLTPPVKRWIASR
jgi:ABC-type uncharacterized transport system permease subunit